MGADQRTLSTQPQTSTFMIKLPQNQVQELQSLDTPASYEP